MTASDPRWEYGPVLGAGVPGLFTADLRPGDRIVVPTDYGTATAARTVASLEAAGHGEIAVRFTAGPDMIADPEEIWAVAP